MPGSARVLAADDMRLLLKHVSRHRYAARDRCIVLLSFHAGLRACEIAGLTWTMVSFGENPSLTIAATISKNGRARRIPMHPELRIALTAIHRIYGRPGDGAVIASERSDHLTSGSIVNWFACLYRSLGMTGCSSHSGRRTFITRTARLLPKAGGSLRDVQELVGHRSLSTTERYIEGDRDAQHRLVSLL